MMGRWIISLGTETSDLSEHNLVLALWKDLMGCPRRAVAAHLAGGTQTSCRCIIYEVCYYIGSLTELENSAPVQNFREHGLLRFLPVQVHM